jgi:hypothetical protein
LRVGTKNSATCEASSFGRRPDATTWKNAKNRVENRTDHLPTKCYAKTMLARRRHVAAIWWQSGATLVGTHGDIGGIGMVYAYRRLPSPSVAWQKGPARVPGFKFQVQRGEKAAEDGRSPRRSREISSTLGVFQPPFTGFYRLSGGRCFLGKSEPTYVGCYKYGKNVPKSGLDRGTTDWVAYAQ